MGTFQSFRNAYGALKDSTKVGLAKVNSQFKDLDVAIVKATNHVECPPKERHVRKIFSSTSALRPRADVAYCIYALAKRLAKTRSWIVAIKVLIVLHRTLREGDPTFREELLNYPHRGHILQKSNFKDDTSSLAWDCSAWVRTYALFLEERLECYRVLKYDIEAERPTKMPSPASKAQCRTRTSSGEELLDQLPALQQLLYRLIGCQPDGAAYGNYLVQYALALALKESFKIYCAINDGIINLVDRFFEMSKHDAVKALNIYKRAGQQAENLAELYEYCKGLELARNFLFPTLRQPPPSFLETMEEYIKEAPQTGSVQKKLEFWEKEGEEEKPPRPEEPVESEKQVENEEEVKPPVETGEEEPQPKEKKEEEPGKPASLIDTDDLLGLNEINPKAAEIEESNALALAIYPPGNDASTPSNDLSLIEAGGTGWELALVTPANSNNINNPLPVVETKLAGGFDKLLLDSLYEDEASRRQIQLTNAGYGYGCMAAAAPPNPFEQQQDPFTMSNNIAPPTNVQMALLTQQYQQQQHTAMQQQKMMMTMMPSPYQYSPQPPQQPTGNASESNPFGDPFLALPASTGTTPERGNHMLL